MTIRSTILVLVLLYSCLQVNAQDPAGAGGDAGAAITSTTPPLELARTAFNAHGGEKMRALKNMSLRGSVELYAPNSTQSVPGTFVLITAGDKLFMEVDASSIITLKQIFDGQRSYSSVPAMELPPASKFGMAVLKKFDQPGYSVTAIPDKKKLRGFRIADSDENATDFYVDPATGRIMSFQFEYRQNTFGTENSRFKEVEGLLVPSSFTQRFEMPQGATFAEFKVKEIKLNQELSDDLFAIPKLAGRAIDLSLRVKRQVGPAIVPV